MSLRARHGRAGCSSRPVKYATETAMQTHHPRGLRCTASSLSERLPSFQNARPLSLDCGQICHSAQLPSSRSQTLQRVPEKEREKSAHVRQRRKCRTAKRRRWQFPLHNRSRPSQALFKTSLPNQKDFRKLPQVAKTSRTLYSPLAGCTFTAGEADSGETAGLFVAAESTG